MIEGLFIFPSSTGTGLFAFSTTATGVCEMTLREALNFASSAKEFPYLALLTGGSLMS